MDNKQIYHYCTLILGVLHKMGLGNFLPTDENINYLKEITINI